MEFTKQIDSAPKNGDFIILQDACSRELGRWAQEANGWVQPDGTPVRISPTHWTRPSDDIDGWTERERLLFLDAPLPDDETEQTQKRPLTRLILALVIAIVCIGGFVVWIGSEDLRADSLAAKLEREFSRERDRASVAIGGLTAARERENVALTEALETKKTADARQNEFKQALDEGEAKSEALARELASARENEVAARNLAAAREREIAAQALETKQTADARQKEFKQALNESEAKSEALARELASARENEVAARNLAAAREREIAAQALETKKTADARQKEFKQALDESEAKSEALARELASARENEVAARNLAAAREREIAAQAPETKNIADARQKEFKQALDESEAKSEALARELASARENEVAARNLAAAREREIAAQAPETKNIADARQKELKEALDESEKRALALNRELTSARETIASAEKPSNAGVTARDAAAPIGPLIRPMEQSNAAPEITISTPQSRGNLTAGVQASSDATPDDAAAGASGRLTRSTRSEPSRPQPPSATSSAEETKLIARAESLIKQFNFVGARLLLAHALEKGSTRAAFMMAETYDWQILRSLQAYGVRGDAQLAREFYQLAAAAGIGKARERMEALQSDANVDTRVGGEKHSR
jgi:hypothetical protein